MKVNASVIISTRDRSRALAETLSSLGRVAVADGLQPELIVVDNGSTDETGEVVRRARPGRFQLKYLYESRVGKANALNLGLARARGEVILFTDDDIRFDEHWLERIVHPMLAHHLDAVAGQVRIAAHLMRPWMSEWHRAWLASTHYLDPHNPEAAVGANMGLSRRVLDRVPQFDPELGPGRLGLYEDTLFSMQIKRAGYRLGMVGDAVVEHHFDPSRLARIALLSHAINEGRSLAYLTWHWKHEDRAWPHLRAARRQLELCARRMVHARECRQSDGVPVWELELVVAIAFLKQLAKERRRPRAYERCGTLKLHAA